MKQEFYIEMDDGAEYTIAADARDIRAWEAEYGASWFAAQVSFTMLAQMAYLAGQRTGVLNGAYPSYADFDAHCVEARGRPAQVAADPTQAAPTGALSARSHSAATSPRPRSKQRGQK